jgi:hypothetical protein
MTGLSKRGREGEEGREVMDGEKPKLLPAIPEGCVPTEVAILRAELLEAQVELERKKLQYGEVQYNLVELRALAKMEKELRAEIEECVRKTRRIRAVLKTWPGYEAEEE